MHHLQGKGALSPTQRALRTPELGLRRGVEIFSAEMGPFYRQGLIEKY